MHKRKITIFFGTRPEILKLVPVIYEFQKINKIIDLQLCFTGQHFEMVEVVLRKFNINNVHRLSVMKKNQTLVDLTSSMIKAVSIFLENNRTDSIIVHGDTSTTFCTSLVAFFMKVPIYHIEAGLRTSDIYNPFPEEFNRRVVGMISHFNFAPTEIAKLNLLNEGISENKILVTGNTIIDTIDLIKDESLDTKLFSKLGLKLGNDIILITIHRRENQGMVLRNICKALLKLASENNQTQFFIPVHPNPNVSSIINEVLGNTKNIILSTPLDYFDLIQVLKHSLFVITDSGGIQEEAPSFGKFVFVIRNETERPEAIKLGYAKLIGTDYIQIYNEVNGFLLNRSNLKRVIPAYNPFGKVGASNTIVNSIKNGN